MEEYAKLLPHHPQHSSMTLFSRLDHLDFVMKCLEKKQRIGNNYNNSNNNSNSEMGMEKKCISLDVALKDTYFKGSLLDRVAALEHRLFQLCLEIDTSSSTNVSTLTSTQTSAEISSSSPTPKQFCKGQPSSSSYPTFHYPPNIGGTSQISQVQEKPQTDQRHQEKKKQKSPSKGQLGKTMTAKDEVGSCKSVKKGNSPSKWPHLRMFGC